MVWADAAPAETAEATGALAEVVVTAERRTENLQDVPITIQAISGAELSELNVTNFNELLKYTPNVTFSGNGPGTGNIFMRGLGSVGSGNQSQTTTAPFPNVGLYLDDQSMQFPARNNDPYLVDMERVEVLEGSAGYALRRRRAGGRDSLHHQQAEPQLQLGDLQRRLRLHRGRRQRTASSMRSSTCR